MESEQSVVEEQGLLARDTHCHDRLLLSGHNSQACQMARMSFLDSTGQTLPHSYSLFFLFWIL